MGAVKNAFHDEICRQADPEPSMSDKTENHVGDYRSAGWMLDQWVCSCGWESEPYFDGAEYAEADWKKHASLSENEVGR